MIELRWYTHPDVPIVDEDRDGRLRNRVAPGLTVLQYRLQSGRMMHADGMGYSTTWGEWQDVPTVSDDTDRSIK